MKIKETVGFTLIEVLVVMAIMAILIALSVSAYNAVRKSSRDGKRRADLEQIRSALEMYRTDCKAYPVTANIGALLGADCDGDGASTVYISVMPSDPVASRTYFYNRTSVNTYALCAALELGGTTGQTGCSGGNDCGTGIYCNYRTTNP